jgi:DNA-binding transcriptional LysR family regulator
MAVAGALDIAFVEGPVSGPNLVVTPWRVDRLVVIAPPDHPLINQQPVSLARLVSEPFIIREPGSGTREVMERAFRERGVQIQAAMEVGSNQGVKQAVSAGLGLSIVSEATIIVALKAGRLARLDVRDFVLTRALTQVTIEGRPPSRVLTAFLTLLQDNS